MLRLLVLLFVLSLAAPERAAAQERICNIVESGRIERRTAGGLPIIDFLDPFFFRCSDGAELRAQTGTLNELMRELTLTGNVNFRDPDRTLTADNAVYNSAIGRLFATGDVVFTNRQEGSELRGPELEYFRPMPGREVAQVNAARRPHLTMQPREADSEAEPLEIDADRVAIVGQDNLTAYGNVVIERSDLDATASEARYNGEEGSLELRGGSRVESEAYDLSAEVIRVRLVEGVLEHLQAVTDASLDGERLSVTAPELQLFFQNEQLQRTVARIGGDTIQRAVAVARGFRLEADSLDAVLPGQQLEQVIAIGGARGETVDTTGAAAADSVPVTVAADSLPGMRGDSATSATALALLAGDWIRGDTVIGFFAVDSAAVAEATDAPGDTAAVELRRIVAKGAAQSLYRITPQQGQPAVQPSRRGLNYLAGETIELTFTEGALQVAEVSGLRHGLYLDPVPASGAAAPPPGGVGDPTTSPEPS